MKIKDISSLNEREKCDKYKDGSKEATGEAVEVNSEDQVDRLKELNENMTIK